MNWFSSIKSKLIIWNALVVMIIYGIVSLVIYYYMRHSLESLVLEKLNQRLTLVSTVVYKSGGDYNDWYHLGSNTPFIIIEQDEVLYKTSAWDHLEFSVNHYDLGNAFVYHLGKKQFLIKSRRVRTGIDIMHDFVVITAIENTDTLERIDDLRGKLAMGVPIIFVFAVAGGYFLANRALKPVKLITKKAKEISAQSLSKRLPIINPRDEIGELSLVINGMLKRIEHSFEQLNRFAADASHEFRTPLTSIRSIGEVALKNELKNPDYREVIGSILEETEHLTSLLNNLLILTRADSGKTQLKFTFKNIAQIIEHVVDEIQVLAEEKEIRLSFSKNEDISLSVHESSLRQALTNVIHNAIVYTSAKGQVDILLKKEENSIVVIEVADTGPGIPVDKRERVFDRFYRMDDTRKDGGSGLGLSIAKWAVEMHGGSIVFVEKPGPGSVCRIQISS